MAFGFCYPDEQWLNAVEKLIKAISIRSTMQWGTLSMIVSHAHIPLLQVGKLSVISDL